MLDIFPVENPNSVRGDLLVAGDAVIILAVVERQDVEPEVSFEIPPD